MSAGKWKNRGFFEMNEARDRAVSLLTHYFDLALPSIRYAGESADRHAEIAEAVDWIIDAAVARAAHAAESASPTS